MTAYRPDYWEDENKALCVVPGIRALSIGQYKNIEKGTVPPATPEITLSRQEKPVSGIRFFAQHLGHQLVALEGIPGNTDKTEPRCAGCGSTKDLQRAGKGYTTLCGDCFTFGGTYRSIKRPGRMGAGWMGLVTPGHTSLATSVDYPPGKAPFGGSKNIALSTGKAAIATFIRDVLLDPPDPPFLLFASGNSSVNVIRGLEVTWSLRRVHISGNDPVIVDAIRLKENLRRWRESGVSVTNVKNTLRLRDEAKYSHNEQTRVQAAEALEKLAQRYELDELLDHFPALHSNDWAWLLRLMNIEERENRAGAKR